MIILKLYFQAFLISEKVFIENNFFKNWKNQKFFIFLIKSM